MNVLRLFRHQPEAVPSMLTEYPLTPDMWKLEQFMFQPIFVCDDMMRGGKNNHLIAQAARSEDTPVHPTCYTSGKFTFFKKDLGEESYPIPLPWDYKPNGFLRWPVEPARIKGQLYAIRPSLIWKVLDIHRQNGIQFVRQKVPILLPYREVKHGRLSPVPRISHDYLVTVDAWMYVGIPEYWDNQIGGIFQSTQMPLHEHDTPKVWIDKFYSFDGGNSSR